MSSEAREEAGYALHCEIDGVRVAVAAEDLSVAGLFVETKAPPEIDREVEIYVRSSVGELVAMGQVVQVVSVKRAQTEQRRPGFGLLFTSLSDDQRAFIGLTLDALLRAQKVARAAAEAARAAKRPRSAPLVDPAHCALIEKVSAELRAELAKLQGKPPWSALGLKNGTDVERAKQAFLDLSKRCHPHKYARYDSNEVSRLATELFITYKRAYSVLTKLAPRDEGRISDVGSSARRPLTSIVPASSGESSPPKPAGAAKHRAR